MKKLLVVELFAASLLLPPLLFAQSDFDGTWKIDLKKTAMPTKPDVFLLQNGTYQCKTCVPVISIKADGQDQNITGTPYYDSISVKVLDDRSIEKTEKKNGKTVATSRMTLSPDGNTATLEFTDSTYSKSDPITGKETLTRVAKSKRSPAGSHAISGTWQTLRIEEVSNNALMFTFKLEDDSLSMTNPTGQSYTAKFDRVLAQFWHSAVVIFFAGSFHHLSCSEQLLAAVLGIIRAPRIPYPRLPVPKSASRS